MIRHCSRCKRDLHENYFKNDFAWCMFCRKAYDKEQYQKNKAKRIQQNKELTERNRKKYWEYLNTQLCAVCGEDDPIVLEFDHLKDKKFNIGDGIRNGKSWKTILKEIQKCQVLCANCHRRKTAKDFNWYKDLVDGA